jgi:predicted GIY-YIG superfamily endonuclease
MPFWVYMLRYADDSYYIGHTENLEVRLAQHQSGEANGYTSNRRQVKCVYPEDCGARLEALEFERQIKGWSRAKKEALINGDWARISSLSKSRQGTRLSTGSGRTG